MMKVDQATVKILEFTAPWASTVDAEIVRGELLAGRIFRQFNPQEREGIWARLQGFQGLVPSLFGFFEDFKLLDAIADCLKWLVHLDPRDTLSTAIQKAYSGVNQGSDFALAPEAETTFTPVSEGFAGRRALGYRQLCVFAMRHYCEIPKKPSGKDLLARPAPMTDTTKLREMADLADRLGFESSEINVLKQHPTSTDSTTEAGNDKPLLVTQGPGEAKKDRYGMPHTQNYDGDRKFLFIACLHGNRNGRAEGITSFFRLRSVYLSFYGMPGLSDAAGTVGDFNPGQSHIPVTRRPFSSAPYPTQFPDRAEPNQTQDLRHIGDHNKQDGRDGIEDTIMQERKEQDTPPAEQDALEREKAMLQARRQKLLADANELETQEQEQEKRRRKVTSDASSLEQQEQEQKTRWQKLGQDANASEKQQQGQKQQRQRLISDANAIEHQEQIQRQQQQELNANEKAFRQKEQAQEQRQQRLISDANVLQEQEQEQEQRRQRLTAGANSLKEQQQKLARDTKAFKKQQREHNKPRTSCGTQVDISTPPNTGQTKQTIEPSSYAQDGTYEDPMKGPADQGERPEGKRTQRIAAQNDGAAKRRQGGSESDDHEALGTSDIEGRKLTENNKYQRLNKYGHRDVNRKDTPLMGNNSQGVTSPMLEDGAATDALTGFTSDTTFGTPVQFKAA